MYEAYSSREFEEKYTYSGRDLGAAWTPQKTAFRLWAPTAEEVTINLYRSGDVHADDLLCQQLLFHTEIRRKDRHYVRL